MSLLIADSGATKTEWRYISESGEQAFQTEGLNPYYHSLESIQRVLDDHLVPGLKDEPVEHLFFYGAGCDREEKKKQVEEAVMGCFPNVDVNVYHDLLGAARACFLHKPGIACILGTGSNSCLYDGEKIIEHIPSLAFILGDEGSAAYFGKKLINQYFRFELPRDLREDLETNYNMSLDHITTGVYEGGQMSRFVASYGAFLGEHAGHPHVREMLREGFESFITRIVMNYSDAGEYRVSFIGSVAYAHRILITNILEEQQLHPGDFISKPMDRLVEFHTNS